MTTQNALVQFLANDQRDIWVFSYFLPYCIFWSVFSFLFVIFVFALCCFIIVIHYSLCFIILNCVVLRKCLRPQIHPDNELFELIKLLPWRIIHRVDTFDDVDFKMWFRYRKNVVVDFLFLQQFDTSVLLRSNYSLLYTGRFQQVLDDHINTIYQMTGYN